MYKKKIAVLIPCYNESLTIGKVIKDFKKHLPEATVYVYDNNSTDGTDVIAKNAGAVVCHEHRQGKGNVIRTMFRDIDADCYLMVDGDDTYPAENAMEMVSHVLNENIDMVIGDRLSSTYFTENKRPFHNIGNKLVKLLINFFFNSKVKDIMTGYRAFSFQFVKSFAVMSKGFEIETEMTIHALEKNMALLSISINYKDRPEGSISKLNTYSDGFKVILKIFNLYRNYRPFKFFTFISLFSFIIGGGFLFPVLFEYVSTGLVLKMPTFFTSVFFFTTSLLSFMLAIILDLIVKKDRRLFEIELNIIELLKRNSENRN